MAIDPNTNDLAACGECGASVVRCGYWDEVTRRPVVMIADYPCAYRFLHRDKWGTLVVDDKKTAMAMAHSFRCSGPQTSLPVKDETTPYQR